MTILTIILEIASIAIIAIVLRNLIKIGAYAFKINLNKWVYLAVGLVLIISPYIPGLKYYQIFFDLQTALGGALVFIFSDKMGWTFGSKNKSEVKAKEQAYKFVNKPKAKPNRVKNSNKNK